MWTSFREREKEREREREREREKEREREGEDEKRGYDNRCKKRIELERQHLMIIVLRATIGVLGENTKIYRSMIQQEID